MEASELRQFSVEDLTNRVKQWREELFRARLKKMGSEMKDVSVFKKLRHDIARGLLVIGEKKRGVTVAKQTGAADSSKAAVTSPVLEDKPVSKTKAKKAKTEVEDKT